MTPEFLRQATGCTAEAAERFAAPLSAACALYGIDTPARLAAFLAQVGHESGSLRYVSELWGPTPAQKTYEGRANLGNTQPGDGERFKGHGLIQTTGRFNHARVRDRLRERFPDVPDFEADPEALTDPQWAAFSAADYWDDKGLNALADVGDFVSITRRINGGLNGQADRLARWEKAKRALSDKPTPEPTMPLPAIIGALLPTIIDAIPKLGKLFGSGSQVAERNVKAAELAVQIVQEATGARNAQEAAEMVKSDPAAAQAATAAVESRWFEMSEAGGGGIEGARKAEVARVASGEPVYKSAAFLVTMALLPLVYMALYAVLFREGFSDDIKAMVLGAVFGGLLTGGITAFWYGTSASSARKTEIDAAKSS